MRRKESMPDDGKTSIPENPTVGTQKKKKKNK